MKKIMLRYKDNGISYIYMYMEDGRQDIGHTRDQKLGAKFDSLAQAVFILKPIFDTYDEVKLQDYEPVEVEV